MSVTFPCIQCFEHCTEPCIQCSRCERWVHINCVPMTESELKTWDNHLLKFYCQQCCYNGIEFDSVQSLERLRISLDSGRRNALLTTAKNEDLLLKTYKVSLPLHTDGTVNELDSVSKYVLQIFHPVLMSDYYPASVVGDGNCLYRAVSRALSGSEHCHAFLRLKTSLELILNRQFYDHKSKSYKDLICDNRVIVSDYAKLVRDSIVLGSYAELAHIYALSASLEKPLRSYFPPQICSEFLSEPFTRKVVGRKVKDNMSVATVMWTQMHVPRTVRDFSPNHFVPLLPRTRSTTEVIDLNTPSNTYDNTEISECTTHQSIDISLPSDRGASTADSSMSISYDVSQPNKTTVKISVSPIKTDNLENNSSEITSELDFSVDDETIENDFVNETSPKCRKTNQSETALLDSSRECEEESVSVNQNMFANGSNSNASSASFVHTFDSKTCGNLDGAFLGVNDITRILAENEKPLEYIPEGVKENVWFVIKNEKNILSRNKNTRSNFRDDCGVWDSGKGSTPQTTYLILPSSELKHIVKRKDLGDRYCFERKRKGKKEYVPLNPQPNENELLTLHKHFGYLKLDNNYKKRVSWLSRGGNTQIALVEYIGGYPGLCPHGNAKHKAEYVRTPQFVMTEMGELLKTNKPQHVYNKLTAKHDDLSGPANLQQLYSKKNRDKVKEREEAGYTYNRNNFADHIKEIENRVTANHPFIRSVVRQGGKAPCIILYTEEQLNDLKNLCCTGQTVLGFDKTFNLCDMHVTMSGYKQLAVKRDTTGEPPLFFGPMYIHDNSDFESYATFFSHIKTKLSGVDTRKLVIGTDDEKAMVNAITSSFPDSHHILCTRHLRQNVNQKLTDAAVDKSDKNMLIEKMFGDEGIINSDDTVCFEEKCEEFESLSQSVSEPFLRYFQKRVKINLDKKRKEPDTVANADKQWTNNNCESLNHVLKQSIQWKSQPLIDLIEQAEELVMSQFTDLRRSLFGMGRFILADSHKQFAISRNVWGLKTQAERERHYKRFRAHVIKDQRVVTSTDGESVVVAPKTKGKKLNQRKRKMTERSVSRKKVKTEPGDIN